MRRMEIREALDAARLHQQSGQLSQADALLRQVLAADPSNREAQTQLAAINNRFAIAAFMQSRLDDALALSQQAIALDPLNADSHHIFGSVFQARGQTDLAMKSFEQAIAISPDHAMAHCSLGVAFAAKSDFGRAIECFKKSIAADPHNAMPLNNLGLALERCGMVDVAIDNFRRAIALHPDFYQAHGAMLLALQYSDRFDPPSVFQEHLRWSERFADPLGRSVQPHRNERDPNRRLRIGYISADFAGHAVSRFLEPILAAHDHEKFEIFCYSDVAAPDEATHRISEMADHWKLIVGKSDDAVADLVRADAIDIFVDTAGHTTDNRLTVFAHRPAPVQITFLGYPGTTGLRQMDYRLTDELADPSGMTEALHTEQLVRLPRTAWCYQPPGDCPDISPLPAQSNSLSNSSITFGSFNNLSKISPRTVALWSSVLRAVPRGRLLLKAIALAHAPAIDHIRQSFAREGIDGDRLELLPPTSEIIDHLRSYDRIDIALDPFPYHGTTTTCEALYMGVPVVTLAGAAHVSRVGVSLLTNVGSPQWIAASESQFVEIASRLAADIPALAEHRRSLRERMRHSPLMQRERYVRELETVYRLLWHRWCETSR